MEIRKAWSETSEFSNCFQWLGLENIGGFVDYHIVRFVEGRYESTEVRKGHQLAVVRGYARQLVEIGSADRVEVRNSANNDLVFLYPRALDRP